MPCVFAEGCPGAVPQVPALLAVGLEGCWGLALSALVLPVLSMVHGSDGRPLDDAPAAVRQIRADPMLAASVTASILSIAFFNFFGVSGEWGLRLGSA